MPLDLSSDPIVLAGACSIEEAEPLLEALRADPARPVDLGGLEHAHTAILQVLMACAPRLVGRPADPVAAACLAGCGREGRA
jgi:hypothetical protein